MRYICILTSFVVISLSSFGQASKTYNSRDLVALRLLPATWERYWNTHNMDSMGTMLRKDVDFVTVAGTWLKGKAEAVKDHKQKHQTMFKSSVWTTDSMELKYLKPDLAIMHIGWGLRGDFDPDGTPRQPRHGIFTWVIIKDKGQWKLLAVHNVNKREPVLPDK
ncbi:SgcJ/EcaC family oxidoreductase [Daejeonella sp.]|uniref:SgcJ/EcaC family oxidoreductase n=1 Tax=Daejeonella sp. TaxID=2805397 RepID=UPI0030BC301E